MMKNKPNPEIIIAYPESSEDYARELNKHIDSIGSEYVISKLSVRQTASINRQTITAEIKKCTVLITFVSKESLKSKWFRTEFSVAIENMWDKTLYLMPILLEDFSNQPYPALLNYFEFVNYSHSIDYDFIARKAIDLACKDRIELPEDFFSGEHNWESYIGSPNETRNQQILDIYDKRLTGLINGTMDGVKNRLKEVINAIAAKEHVLSPITIKFREGNVHKHVWVITRFLHNDLTVKEIMEGVNDNLKTGKKYVYFIPKGSQLAKERAIEYEQMENKKDYKNQFKFIFIEEDLVMPFEELVIYDPLEVPRTWGYVQYTFQRDHQPEDLFLKLDKSLLTELVAKFQDKYPEAIQFMFGREQNKNNKKKIKS